MADELTPHPHPRTHSMSKELVAAGQDAGAGSAHDATAELVGILRGLRNGNGRGKRFLGLTAGDWTKMLLAWGLATVVFVSTWYRTVNDGLDARPTKQAVEESIKQHNNAGAHPEAVERLKVLEAEQRAIRESQIRAEGVDKQQTEVLREIKTDVRRIRRSR